MWRTSGYAKHEDVMHLMRCLFFITASFSLSVISQHLPGCHNQAADALSLDNLQLFHYLVHQAPLSPSPISLPLVELLVSLVQNGQTNGQLGFLLFCKGFSSFNKKGIHICSEPLSPFLFSQQFTTHTSI